MDVESQATIAQLVTIGAIGPGLASLNPSPDTDINTQSMFISKVLDLCVQVTYLAARKGLVFWSYCRYIQAKDLFLLFVFNHYIYTYIYGQDYWSAYHYMYTLKNGKCGFVFNNFYTLKNGKDCCCVITLYTLKNGKCGFVFNHFIHWRMCFTTIYTKEWQMWFCVQPLSTLKNGKDCCCVLPLYTLKNGKSCYWVLPL